MGTSQKGSRCRRQGGLVPQPLPTPQPPGIKRENSEHQNKATARSALRPRVQPQGPGTPAATHRLKCYRPFVLLPAKCQPAAGESACWDPWGSGQLGQAAPGRQEDPAHSEELGEQAEGRRPVKADREQSA